MTIDLDNFELLHFLEGCLIGSHLRQGIWERAVNEFYGKLRDEDRNFIFHYAVRDFTGRANSCAKEDFAKFIARYNPYNQYKIELSDGTLQEAFKYNDKYFVKLNTFVPTEYIVTEYRDKKRLNKYLERYEHLKYEIENKITID